MSKGKGNRKKGVEGINKSKEKKDTKYIKIESEKVPTFSQLIRNVEYSPKSIESIDEQIQFLQRFKLK